MDGLGTHYVNSNSTEGMAEAQLLVSVVLFDWRLCSSLCRSVVMGSGFVFLCEWYRFDKTRSTIWGTILEGEHGHDSVLEEA